LSLQREFAGSRLEEQILRRAFELVLPVLDRGEGEPPKAEADHSQANFLRSPGA
jgi:hypothetical protein